MLGGYFHNWQQKFGSWQHAGIFNWSSSTRCTASSWQVEWLPRNTAGRYLLLQCCMCKNRRGHALLEMNVSEPTHYLLLATTGNFRVASRCLQVWLLPMSLFSSPSWCLDYLLPVKFNRRWVSLTLLKTQVLVRMGQFWGRKCHLPILHYHLTFPESPKACQLITCKLLIIGLLILSDYSNSTHIHQTFNYNCFVQILYSYKLF